MAKDRLERPQIKYSSTTIKMEEESHNQIQNEEPLLLNPEHPDALVIQCSDGRYTSIVSKFMNRNGVDRYDVMAMPGGPALLDMQSASIIQSEACKSGTSFLVKGHGIKRIWLLAHANCGYYRYNLNGMPSHVVIDRQIEDLRRAAKWLSGIDKNINVHASFIELEKNIVNFREIELDANRTKSI